MLKHVQISPLRNRSDSMSIRSTTSCSSSLCGSPEPPSDLTRTPSRASSYSSLNETIPQTTIKIYTACLKVDIEYKTLGITWDTTCREVITSVLRRCKQRHRDPRLFYLSMEVTVRRAGIRTVLMLDDDARPAVLQACHPKGDSRFCLQLKPGGLVRVHTSVLQPTSQYKSLIISEETTSDELLGLLLSCYNSSEPIEQFSLYEVCPGQEYQRKLHPDDLPLRSQAQRQQNGEKSHFTVRRNPNYPRRRTLLPPISEKHTVITNSDSLQHQIINCDSESKNIYRKLDFGCDEKKIESINNNNNNNNHNDTNNNNNIETNNNNINSNEICRKCRNNFKTCDFCNKYSLTTSQTTTYSPVYNLREIRSVCHAFSAFGIDKKLMEAERGCNNNNNNNNINNNNNSNTNQNLLSNLNSTQIVKTYNGRNSNRHSYCSSTYTTNNDELSNNALNGIRNFQYV